MSRWTVDQLDNTDDLAFIISILNERINKLGPYSPLAKKINRARRNIEELREIVIQAYQDNKMSDTNLHRVYRILMWQMSDELGKELGG